MKRRNSAAVLLGCLLQAACSSLPGQEPWGSSATLSPGWERVSTAARDAALHPGTMYPLAVAAGLQIDNADQRLSDWARRKTPIYGSTNSAINASNDGLATARALYYVVAMTAPSGDTPGEWFLNKGQGLVLDRVAVEINSRAYGELKDSADRIRPDGSDDNSFPSGHAGKSSAYSTLGMLTTAELGLGSAVETGIDATFIAAAAATGWARVEGGRHYPSDVLAGYALGNFMARFVRNAFLPADSPVVVAAMPEGFYLGWQQRF